MLEVSLKANEPMEEQMAAEADGSLYQNQYEDDGDILNPIV